MSSGFKQILPLKILAKQGIIAESETKPKSGNRTSGEMKDGNGHKIRKNPL